jgi:hypothetical protein
MPLGVGTILGGLPVVADVSFGRDDFTGEYWAEVEHIYWLKKGDKPGKKIPQHVRDRAAKYDHYFSNLIEQVSDYLAYQNYEEQEKVQLL